MPEASAPDDTLGGYWEKHTRPPAFGGSDGAMYSVEIYIDDDPPGDEPFAGALLFVRWSDDGAQPVSHLETEYLAFGAKRSEVKATLQSLSLVRAKEHLERLIERRRELPNW